MMMVVVGDGEMLFCVIENIKESLTFRRLLDHDILLPILYRPFTSWFQIVV